MKKLIIIPVLFLFILSSAQTQIKKSSIDNGGAVYTNGNISVTYTTGETFISENTNGNIHISEGFIGGDFLSASGVSELHFCDKVSLYPNPADNILNISANEKIKNILILDITGKEVFFGNFNSEKINVDVSDFKNGFYIIRLNFGNRFEKQKFIKQ